MQNDINQYMDRDEMSLEDWDLLLNAGWDRVGSFFFHRRFDMFQTILDEAIVAYELMPIRYALTDFKFSKSQRIIQKRNADLKRVYRPTILSDEKFELFDTWYTSRFYTEGSIFTWVTGQGKPFPTMEVSIYKEDKLVACSFFDVTLTSQYSTLAMYDPNEYNRSLGTYTLISEVEYGIQNHKKFHYPGHAYAQKSIYDYKKRFNNLEHFHWETQTWQRIPRLI